VFLGRRLGCRILEGRDRLLGRGAGLLAKPVTASSPPANAFESASATSMPPATRVTSADTTEFHLISSLTKSAAAYVHSLPRRVMPYARAAYLDGSGISSPKASMSALPGRCRMKNGGRSRPEVWRYDL
jgi:hypothetical protein